MPRNFNITAYMKRVIEETCVLFGNNGYSHVINYDKIHPPVNLAEIVQSLAFTILNEYLRTEGR